MFFEFSSVYLLKIYVMKKLILLLLFVVISCQKSQIARLNEKVPNYTFEDVLNSSKKEISLNSLEGKPVILEFWATWCGACLPAMKKLDTIQSKFKNQIEIITISNESTKRLSEYIESSKTNLKIVSDKTHSISFKYKVVPHTILIDKNGIVKAITSPENINEKVIDKLINGKELNLAVKDDFYIDPDLEVKTINSIYNKNYQIELTNYNQKNRGGYRPLKNLDGKVNGIEMWNSPIIRMYQTLFNVSSSKRIVFADSLSFKDFPYKKEHQYNFKIQIADGIEKDWQNIAKKFLDDSFDVNAKMKIDTLDCYVLLNDKNILKPSSSEKKVYTFRGSVLKTKKIKMKVLADYIENFTSLPVVDKTNLDSFYDINLEWQSENPKTLHQELTKYGLKLEKSKEKLPIEVLEIYKKKTIPLSKN